MFVLGGCAEGNLGWGAGQSKGAIGNDISITFSEKDTKLYGFKSPAKGMGDWRVVSERFKSNTTFDNASYYISQNWIALSSRFIKSSGKMRLADPINSEHTIESSYLSEYLAALKSKQTFSEAHTAYFSAFYPNSTVLSQEQRSVKGIKCMQTKAIYNKEYLVELQCPVFFRNTFGTITYLMHTMGGGNTVDLIDQNIPAFNHMVDTLEFIEPPSQKMPEGFSLDEQFKRIQEPNWKL